MKFNKRELKIGTSMEREHKDTFRFIRNFIKKKKQLPADKKIAEHIAMNHLRKNPSYYRKLRRCKL